MPSTTLKTSAADLVCTGILQSLEDHSLAPGQRLVEADLAIEFGVGRNSVREALQRLSANGVVELSKHKGASIRTLTIQEAHDVLDIAERMMGLLARSATRGSQQPVMREALLLALSQLQMAASDSAPLQFSAARRRYYRALLEMAGNRELQRLLPTLLSPTVHLQWKIPRLYDLRVEAYQKIAQAVLDDAPDLAEKHARDHVQKIRKLLPKDSAI